MNTDRIRGGGSHDESDGVVVVSLRGANYGFQSHLKRSLKTKR